MTTMRPTPSNRPSTTRRGELYETDDRFELELDLPGVDTVELSVAVSGRRVSVHGSTARAFTYEVALPVPVDESAVTATLHDGVLALAMPKATAAQATHIDIA